MMGSSPENRSHSLTLVWPGCGVFGNNKNFACKINHFMVDWGNWQFNSIAQDQSLQVMYMYLLGFASPSVSSSFVGRSGMCSTRSLRKSNCCCDVIHFFLLV